MSNLYQLRKSVVAVLCLQLACLTPATLARPEMRRADISSSASVATAVALPQVQYTSTNIYTETDSAFTLIPQPGHLRLRKRKDNEDEEKSGSASKTSTETSAETSKPSSTGQPTGTRTVLTISVSVPTATTVSSSSPLPQPFDGSIFADFASDSNCPKFLQSILTSPTFESCYPLSLMLQTSNGFFEAQKQLLRIVRVLDATCAADVSFCTNYFKTAAQNLTSSDNCEAEWKAGTLAVKEAYFGMRAYETMYKATCLQDPAEDMYCFANAVTNLTSASDAYFYFLPYNLTLPGSTVPSCDWCTRETMAIFHAATSDRSQYIAKTYEGAARQVNTICGPSFVNGTLAEESSAAGRMSTPAWGVVLFSLLGTALVNALV